MKKRLTFLVSVLLISGLTFGMSFVHKASASAPETNYLVSSDSSGNIENSGYDSSGSNSPRAVSANGRYVVFVSSASNLVSGDTNGVDDVFVKDTQTGAISAVSVSTAGVPADQASSSPRISYDGRYVVFQSNADNIVSGVSGVHVYRRDLLNNTTVVVDTTASGIVADNSSGVDDVSANGRFVLFGTIADNILGTTQFNSQLVIKDMNTGAIQVVSKNASGALGNKSSGGASISCDGSIVAFSTNATNLAASYSGNSDLYVARVTWNGSELSDVTPSVNQGITSITMSCNGNVVAYDSLATNIVSPSTPSGRNNVYEYSLLNGSNTLVSVNGAGTIGNSGSGFPSISDDGNLIAFASMSTNLDTSYPNPYGASPGNIFVRDLKHSTTELVSITALGNVGNNDFFVPSLSEDGSYVAYGYWTPDSSHSVETLISGLTVSSSQSDFYESKTGY